MKDFFGTVLLSAATMLANVCQGQTTSGGDLFKHAQQVEAAGNRTAAAAAYQKAYEAYMSVDDSEGMIKSLNKKQALSGGPAAPVAATLRPTLRPAATPPRPAPATGPSPVAGRTADGRPLGLFFMTHYIPAWRSLEKATWYFAPNGQVFHNPQGLDAAGYAALPPGDRGVYQAGATPTVKWADGRTQPFKIEPTGSTSFNYDMSIFVGMGPFGSTREIVGRFEGGNSVTGAASASGLELQADGSYAGSSSGTVSATTNQGTFTGGSSGESAGRWGLSGWVLTLTDNTGRTTRSMAYPIEKDEKTGQVVRFYFNNVVYKRL